MNGHGIETRTAEGSFSFYVTAHRSDLILPASELADAVNAYLEPMRAERERWQSDRARLDRHVENARSLNESARGGS